MKTLSIKTIFVAAFVATLALVSSSCSKEDPEPDPIVEEPKPEEPNPVPEPEPSESGWIIDTLFHATGNYARNIERQPDGKMLIATDTQLGRINPDGSRDEGFPIVTVADGVIQTLVLLPDGKFLIGGSFTSVEGQGYVALARINANGTVDASFEQQDIRPIPLNGSSQSVKTIAVSSSGKLYIGGHFVRYTGEKDQYGADVGISKLVRLEANGAIDLAFRPTGLLNNVNGISAVSVLDDGKVLVVGKALQAQTGIYPNTKLYDSPIRINEDGSIDEGFRNTVKLSVLPSDTHVYTEIAGQSCVLPLTDGSFLVGGDFNTVDQSRTMLVRYITRFESDGKLDASFASASRGKRAATYTMLALTSSEILIGTLMTNLDHPPIFSLDASGKLEESFWHPDFKNRTYIVPGAGKYVSTAYDLVKESDDVVVVAGLFIQHLGYDPIQGESVPVKSKGLLRLVRK